MTGRLDGPGILESDAGSTIAVTDAEVPGDLRGIRGDGIGFGALRLTSWAESITIIEGLTFEDADASSWVPFLAAGGVAGTAANRDPDDATEAKARRSLTRRGILASAGAAATTLFVGNAAAQDGDTQTYNVASFDVAQNLRGLKVDVDVGVAEWLEGEDVEFFLSADGSTIGTFNAAEQGKTINPGTTGTVELESDTALTFVQEMLAKWGAEDKVIFEFRPQDTSFAEEAVDSEIELSSEPVVVETVNQTDPDGVVLKLNETIIPHTDERGDKPAGEWYVRDNTSLMYVVGPETPDTSLVEVQANVGWLDRTREEYGW